MKNKNFNNSRRNFFRTASGAIILGASATTLVGCGSSSSDNGDGDNGDNTPLLTPKVKQLSGRYIGAQTIYFEDVPENVEIRYTLDRFEPSRSDKLYNPAEGITLTESKTICARAFRDEEESEMVIHNYLVKTEEEPLFRMIAMSDTEFRNLYEPGVVTGWNSHFDVLQHYMPNPDLIINAGDLIADNDKTTGWTHSLLRNVFEQNMNRVGMLDTQVLLARGNHDAYTMDMVNNYPKSWFPIEDESENGGFYHTMVKNIHVIGYDSNLSNTHEAQNSFVEQALQDIKNSADYNGEPIIVQAHHPLPGGVCGGAWNGGNSIIRDILSKHPEVIHFSGHSHYPLTDDRSIFQDTFTHVNCASPSTYNWLDGSGGIHKDDHLRGYNYHPIWSLLLVEIYEDRVEFDRIAMAADPYFMVDVGRPDADYSDNELSPLSFRSAGALLGEAWTFQYRNEGLQQTVELDKYNQARLDVFKNTKFPFEHNINLTASDGVARLWFNNVRGHITAPQMYYIRVSKVNSEGNEGDRVFAQSILSDTQFVGTRQRFEGVPLHTNNTNLEYGVEYYLVLNPQDSASNWHDDSGVHAKFTLEGLEQGEFEVVLGGIAAATEA
ncbi:metallophosphoesterase [Photobacterium sp. DNB23_23_1]